MADTTPHTPAGSPLPPAPGGRSPVLAALAARARRIDRVLLAIALLLAGLAIADPAGWLARVNFALGALGRTAPVIAVAVLALAYVKAAGAETLLGRAFHGRERTMILGAALVGVIAPFCSCQVIPFVAAALAVGAPLSAVMAFWLASPLMDPAMFALTAGVLGTDFALAKAVFAVALALAGGGLVHLLVARGALATPLRAETAPRCCSARNTLAGTPEWRFWREAPRRAIFLRTTWENVFFLGKWLLLAYVVEAMMVAYVPAGLIAQYLGGGTVLPVVLGAVLGAPAYLNGFAAVPLMDALLSQGMAPGAAMSFVVAGGLTSIPAMLAVWALVRPGVFAVYLGLGFAGALISGFGWTLLA